MCGTRRYLPLNCRLQVLVVGTEKAIAKVRKTSDTPPFNEPVNPKSVQDAFIKLYLRCGCECFSVPTTARLAQRIVKLSRSIGEQPYKYAVSVFVFVLLLLGSCLCRFDVPCFDLPPPSPCVPLPGGSFPSGKPQH